VASEARESVFAQLAAQSGTGSRQSEEMAGARSNRLPIAGQIGDDRNAKIRIQLHRLIHVDNVW
jgi:hypothetical protein